MPDKPWELSSLWFYSQDDVDRLDVHEEWVGFIADRLVRADGLQVEVSFDQDDTTYNIYVEPAGSTRSTGIIPGNSLPYWLGVEPLAAQAVLFELQKSLPLEVKDAAERS